MRNSFVDIWKPWASEKWIETVGDCRNSFEFFLTKTMNCDQNMLGQPVRENTHILIDYFMNIYSQIKFNIPSFIFIFIILLTDFSKSVQLFRTVTAGYIAAWQIYILYVYF